MTRRGRDFCHAPRTHLRYHACRNPPLKSLFKAAEAILMSESLPSSRHVSFIYYLVFFWSPSGHGYPVANFVHDRFATVLDSLPKDAQQTLIYHQLIPLLNTAPKSKVKKALNAAARLQKRHAGRPDLDLRGKEREISNMLKELNKDTKRAYVVDTSNRIELLTEIAESLAVWMSDVWVVVYEHNVDFCLAHDCLLFVSSTLDRLENVRMGYASYFILSKAVHDLLPDVSVPWTPYTSLSQSGTVRGAS